MSSSAKPLPAVRACLFDMDGLLIDSEDLYSLVTNKVLAEFGRPKLPWSIKAQLQGRPYDEASKIFRAWSQLPISDEEYHAKIAKLQAEHFPSTKPLPGVPVLLKNLMDAGVQIAVATSSITRNYNLKTSHLPELFSLFPERQIVRGDDPRIPKGRGKPAPDIYEVALETVNEGCRQRGEKELTRDECLVFEDSVPGVEAGRRAGMQVVWCPHPELLLEYKGKEEEVLAGQTGEMKPLSGEDTADNSEKVLAGWPGQKGDGWAVLVNSLEDFDYGRFGIQKPS